MLAGACRISPRVETPQQRLRLTHARAESEASETRRFLLQNGASPPAHNAPLWYSRFEEAFMVSNILSRRREDREKWGDRLPPGQKVVEDWPVLTYGGTPRVDLKAWRLRLFGLVEKDVEFFWEQYGYHIRGDPWKEERYS